MDLQPPGLPQGRVLGWAVHLVWQRRRIPRPRCSRRRNTVMLVLDMALEERESEVLPRWPRAVREVYRGAKAAEAKLWSALQFHQDTCAECSAGCPVYALVLYGWARLRATRMIYGWLLGV